MECKRKHFTPKNQACSPVWDGSVHSQHLSSSRCVPDTILHTLAQINILHSERRYRLPMKRTITPPNRGPPLSFVGPGARIQMKAQHNYFKEVIKLANCHINLPLDKWQLTNNLKGQAQFRVRRPLGVLGQTQVVSTTLLDGHSLFPPPPRPQGHTCSPSALISKLFQHPSTAALWPFLR